MATTRNEAVKEFLVAYAKAGSAVILSQIYDGQHYPLYFFASRSKKIAMRLLKEIQPL
jgi:hypothetical protein